MKILIALCAILAVSTARVVINAEGPENHDLWGKHECTWGPSYWCENIKSAAGCNATKHCIKTKWINMQVPEDNDSVCDVCKKMVQQARDQLESNQTQEDLRAVFEGSCRLIHIKPIVKECITIVDQFIPELVETLASQMNPSVVCSVAGLCNSAHIDKLLLEHAKSEPKVEDLKTRSLEKDELEPDECSKCYTVAAHMEAKLKDTPRDRALQQMLTICGELGSFSDACSAIVLTYFDTIYTHLQENFNAENICHLSGQCSAKFHKHEDADKSLKVEIRPLSSVGMVDINDDLPCKLCEQLVGHLRDLLVANTTEIEFEHVLKGLCKQTKSFSTECTAIVEEYYPQMYEYLTKSLNSNIVCQMSGLCPAPAKRNHPIWPLVPENAAEVGMRIFENTNKNLESDSDEQLAKSEVEAMQLPIERLMPFPLSEGSLGVEGKETCALCEYILHYIQDAITNPATEDKIKEALGKVCKKLPLSIEDQCTEFVNVYGDAVVAILAQEIDPSQVCPMLRLCPTEKLMELWHSVPAKYVIEEERNKPSCPLCLLAISQIYEVIKNNKTEANIEAQLDKLCVHLPHSLVEECTELVKGYSKELIELLLADLTPQEVCVYLKLCDAEKNPGPRSVSVIDMDGEILTNEIPNNAVEENLIDTPTCVICEYAMEYIDKELDGQRGRNKVEHAVHTVCNHLPKSVSRKCNNFVNRHADDIIDVITKDISPKQVCTVLSLCTILAEELEAPTAKSASIANNAVEENSISFPTCIICEFAMKYIDKELGGERGRNKTQHAVHTVCNHLPKSVGKKCNNFVNRHGDGIIDVITKGVSPKQVCTIMSLCTKLAEELEAPPAMATVNANNEVSENLGGAPTCVICEYAMEYIGEALGDERGRNVVEHAVHTVCNHLPESVSNKCNNFVTRHGDRIIDVITKGVSPKQVCTVMSLCTKLVEELEAPTAKSASIANNAVEENSISFPTCIICEFAMKYIDKELGGERGRNKTQHAVHTVCNHLPKSVGKKCNNFVNRHGDGIIDVITKGVSPKQVCTIMSLCTKLAAELEAPPAMATVNANNEVSENLGGAPTCVICEYAMEYIGEALGDERGRNVVEHAVHTVCNHLPESVSNKCNNFINRHADDIIDAITKGVSPKQVCTVLSLCPKFSQELGVSITNCGVCKEIMSAINELLDSQHVDDSIIHVVAKVCKQLPSSVEHKCDTIINSFGPSIINLVKQHEYIPEICGKLGLCARNVRSTVFLETSRSKRSYEKNRIKHCTWGPVYWCSTNETARECKAVEHCKEHVWKSDFAPSKQITLSEAEPNA